MDFHANAGPFKGWLREELRAWQDEQLARLHALWSEHSRHASGTTPPAIPF
jgi:hypothetical protein